MDIEKLRSLTICKLDNDKALEHIGILIDRSLEEGYERGADRALYLLDQFEQRDLPPELYALAEYFRANAWGAKEESSKKKPVHDWEHPHHEQQISALSKAATHSGFKRLPKMRRCQILTNRANLLSAMGRFIDAVEGWDAALQEIPIFANPQIGRAYGLEYYAKLLYDDWHKAIFLLHAYDGFTSALANGTIYEKEDKNLQSKIAECAKNIETAFDIYSIRELQNLDKASLGRSKSERSYRKWCLNHRLFLNPINDLGAYASAACDELILPPITERFDERPGSATPPPVIGFFNQIKQEYVSARFMLYEGLHSTGVHFSDRHVLLFNTLEYPVYSYAAERIRTAFRTAYSILDKVAVLIDHYWKLEKDPRYISFKSVWKIERGTQLLDQLREYKNWPLRGLYWLSKELFEEQLNQTTAPDARDLHDIRNALEHKYLQIRESWSLPNLRDSVPELGLSISDDELAAKALRIMKIARSVLIHLSLAISIEEQVRSRKDPDKNFIAQMPLYSFEESRKRRDPF